MLLLADIGNTALKLCAWEDGPRQQWEVGVGEGLRDSLRALLQELPHGVPADWVVCSVVPQATATLCGEARDLLGLEPMVVGLDWASDVEICLRNPQTMGLDRYVDAVAAAGLYPGRSRIVIDYGTATTYDLVLADGRFVAGLICAGAGTSVWALHQKTALLPLVPVEVPPRGILADNTRDSMVAGNFYARIGETRHIVEQLRLQAGLEETAVVSTGGFGELMQRHSGVIHRHVPHLMFLGMERLYRFAKGGQSQ